MMAGSTLDQAITAALVAWFGITIWLEGFAEKISIGPFIYILASLLGLTIGWLSIIYQALKAAGYNPAEALRYR